MRISEVLQAMEETLKILCLSFYSPDVSGHSTVSPL